MNDTNMPHAHAPGSPWASQPPDHAAATAERGLWGFQEHIGVGSVMLGGVMPPASASASRVLSSTLAKAINRLKLGSKQQ